VSATRRPRLLYVQPAGVLSHFLTDVYCVTDVVVARLQIEPYESLGGMRRTVHWSDDAATVNS